MSLNGIYYIEDKDFDEDNIFKHDTKGKPVILLLQGSFCGHCQKFKPTYQKAADNNRDCIWATVQVDGSESEKKVAQKFVDVIPGFDGAIPFVAGFKDGKLVSEYEGNRTVKSLEEFKDSL